MAAMAMAMAATSTRVMASQQSALNHRTQQGVDRTNSLTANCRGRTRAGVVSVKPTLWQAAPRGFGRRSSVIAAAVGGEIEYVFRSYLLVQALCDSCFCGGF